MEETQSPQESPQQSPQESEGQSRQPVDTQVETQECRHLYLTGEAVCIHCGLEFKLRWSATRGWLVRPAVRNGVLAVLAIAGVAYSELSGLPLVSRLLLIVAVLFFTRAMLGIMETFMRHRFVPGKLGPLYKRPFYNILTPKPHLARVGRVAFPMHPDAHAMFDEGDTVLVEHLRWSRLPIAMYKGEMPKSKSKRR